VPLLALTCLSPTGGIWAQPFSDLPLRTGHARFRSIRLSNFCVPCQVYQRGLTHHTASPPLPKQHSHLPPLALYQAFPGSDYYGGSVTLELALRRRSRLCARETYLVRVGALFVSLPCSLPGTHRREPSRAVVYSSL